MPVIEAIQVTKHYEDGGSRVPVLKGIDLALERGEIVALEGPSGSGKTTLLRLIAGLESPDSGTLLIGGRDVGGVPPHHRNVAMVFQTPALYPYLNVFDNLGFGLKARGIERSQRRERIHAVAGMLGIDRLLKRRPAELSGGERQRVALGRAVARKPAVLLLDEPFSSLDAPLRAALRGELVDLHRRLGTTLVHVTHDQGEALSIGQNIAVMNRGRLMQAGTPEQIHDQPTQRFVASFVGHPVMSLLHCEVTREETQLVVRLLGTDPVVSWQIPCEECDLPGLPRHQPRLVDLGVRSGSIITTPESFHMGSDCFSASAVIHRLEFEGGSTLLATLSLGNQTIQTRMTRGPETQEGVAVSVHFEPSLCAWFNPDSGERLEVNDWTSRETAEGAD
jgi:multiple sugar transport system ATP-binding protein